MERITKILIVLAVFLSPLSNAIVIKTGFFDLKATQILWALLFLATLTNREIFVSAFSRKDKVIFAFYLLAITMSMLFSQSISNSFKEYIQYLYLFIIFIVLVPFLKRNETKKLIVYTIVASNILFVVVSILSYIRGGVIFPSYLVGIDGTIMQNKSVFTSNTLMNSGEKIIRLYGIFGLTATGICNCILIQSPFISYVLRLSSGVKKVLFFTLILLNFIVVILTYSRIGIILFVAVHVFLFMRSNSRYNFGIFLTAAIGLVCLLNIFPEIYQRVMETFNTQEQSSRYHFAFWLIALETGMRHYISGIGLGNVESVANMAGSFTSIYNMLGLAETQGVNVHNFALQIWAEQGILGVVASLLLLCNPIIALLVNNRNRLFERQRIFIFVVCAFICTLIYNLTNNNYYIEILWMMIAFVYAEKNLLDEEDEKDLGVSLRGLTYEKSIGGSI